MLHTCTDYYCNACVYWFIHNSSLRGISVTDAEARRSLDNREMRNGHG